MDNRVYPSQVYDYFQKEEIKSNTKLNILHINLDMLKEKGSYEYDDTSTIFNDLIYGVFLFHGVGGSSLIWYNQIPLLINLGFDVIAIDLLGHGRSSVSKDSNDYSFAELSRNILALYDKFKRPLNFLIGHSYGCCFAAFIAHERRDSVIGLSFLAGGPPVPMGEQFGVLSLPLCFLTCFQNLLWRIFMKKSFYKNEQQELLQRPSTFVLQCTMLGQIWEESDTNYYASLKVPILILHGRQDKLVTTDEAEFMYRTLKNSELYIVEESGHMIMLDQPETTNKLISNFITDIFNLDN